MTMPSPLAASTPELRDKQVPIGLDATTRTPAGVLSNAPVLLGCEGKYFEKEAQPAHSARIWPTTCGSLTALASSHGGDLRILNLHRSCPELSGKKNSASTVKLAAEPPMQDSEGTRYLRISVVVRLAFFAGSSGLLFGVDLGSIAGALLGMTEDLELTMGEKQAVVSGAKGGAIFGCLVGGALMTARGRRNAVALSSVPFLVGPLVVGFSIHFVMALVGRLAMGVGIGIASVAAPCYLSEVAPRGVRGGLVALYELAIAFGFLFASIANYVIEHAGCMYGGCWRYQAGGLPCLAALPLLLSVALIPESPRWLLTQAGGDVQRLREALEAMRRIKCEGAEERLETIHKAEFYNDSSFSAARSPWHPSSDELINLWDEQHAAAGLPLLLSHEAAAARPSEIAAPAKQASTLYLLHTTLAAATTVARGTLHVPLGADRGLLLALLAAVLNQCSASTSILVYAQHLLAEAGIESRKMQDLMAIAVAISKLVGVATGLLIINRVGRRLLLGLGGALSSAALALLAFGAASANITMLLSGMCCFILVFCATWGIGYWVVVTEVTAAAGPQLGAACQAVATAALFMSGWLTSLTFVSVIENGGPFALMTYSGIAALMVVYALALLPEMRGYTLEECTMLVRQMPIEACLAWIYALKESWAMV